MENWVNGFKLVGVSGSDEYFKIRRLIVGGRQREGI